MRESEDAAGSDPTDCPFCEGHEERTPPETFALAPLGREPDTPGWWVRVVPNLFPAFTPAASVGERDGLLISRPARGRQEVAVNTARHVRSVVELTDEELDRVAETWRSRALAARAEGFPYLHAIVNEGREAGASLAHTHSQLVWLDREPPAVAQERRLAGEAGGCLVDRLLETERDERVRLVAERDGAIAVASFAGRQPYELLVAPDTCESDPWTSPTLEAALRLAVRTLGAIHMSEEGRVAANLWLHAGPHWHIEVVPRLSVPAGIELGAEISVNTVTPEGAAERLRARL